MRPGIYAAVVLVVLAVVGGGLFSYGNAKYKQGLADAKTACANEKADQSARAAQDFANRPRTVFDAVKRLRERASDKR